LKLFIHTNQWISIDYSIAHVHHELQLSLALSLSLKRLLKGGTYEKQPDLTEYESRLPLIRLPLVLCRGNIIRNIDILSGRSDLYKTT
jgi:hypothetical protein